MVEGEKGCGRLCAFLISHAWGKKVFQQTWGQMWFAYVLKLSHRLWDSLWWCVLKYLSTALWVMCENITLNVCVNIMKFQSRQETSQVLHPERQLTCHANKTCCVHSKSKIRLINQQLIQVRVVPSSKKCRLLNIFMNCETVCLLLQQCSSCTCVIQTCGWTCL